VYGRREGVSSCLQKERVTERDNEHGETMDGRWEKMLLWTPSKET
jgi:hypothetical protein